MGVELHAWGLNSGEYAERFYLLTDGERTFIDSRAEDHAILGEIGAEDWIEAKQEFGFELTPLQEELLPLDAAGRERVMSRERWFGFSQAFVREDTPGVNRKGWSSKQRNADVREATALR